MEEFLIVDGYNIIGAWPELNKLKDTDLEGARDKLIHMLAEYQSYSGMKVYLVFDAYMVPGLGKKYVQSKLNVLYTKEKETADERIERLVTNLMGRRRQIYVATSDMIEQHVIFGKGALRLPAGELLVKIKQNRKEVRERIKPEVSTKRNPFEGKLSGELKAQFERWRRGE
ncbi:NYN domain-containing protein [Paenibacillus sp. GCM10023248]|uniref:NYN domain-containing protein n=1 Tax=Bacillales TaxID=1385 RepID=UPI002378D443|nr:MULTISPECIES: NYN domain-containing protein [Bacillales]MDD9272133.1 NYN domain-containing protein [Paenibacillus sp. MAHUQ-63]MDR6885261.1 putative RNA-binding protein with PIN domain [Bacillus sp. 3255]